MSSDGVPLRIGVTPGPNRLIVRVPEKESRTASGLIIPETAGREPATSGVVVAVTPLEDGNDGEYAYPVGTQVIFTRFTGTEINIPLTNDPSERRMEKLIVLFEKDVMAIVAPVPHSESRDGWYITDGAADAVGTAARTI